MIYADNAATTQMSRAAIHAMLPYMERDYGNPSSLHSVGQKAAEALQNAREKIADCLGCQYKEIYFTSGGSEADNQAILSAAKIGEKIGKKHIISTAFEHHAVLHTLKKLENQGFEVKLLPVGAIGTATAQQVADTICENTCLVTIIYANNEIGSILPIAEIGAVCRERDVLFHTDAVQAAGHLHINVKEQNIDKSHTYCSLDNVEDARSIAYRLHMPYYVFNFTKDFKDNIIDKFVKSYEMGVTPNPCIDCNRYMKFGKLFERAKVLNCEYIATGHYARIENDDNGTFILKKALDETKDQSYVLYAMTQEQLSHTLFPLGCLHKTKTREIASESAFINAEKPDSQDICFVPNGKYTDIVELHSGRKSEPGDFRDKKGFV